MRAVQGISQASASVKTVAVKIIFTLLKSLDIAHSATTALGRSGTDDR